MFKFNIVYLILFKLKYYSDISTTSVKGNINDLFTNPCNLEYM